jgi:FkbM family methyltransferase
LITPGIAKKANSTPEGQLILSRLRRLEWMFFAVLIPNPITVQGGYRMFWHKGLFSCVLRFRLGSYERETVLLFQKLLQPGMTVVDLGASIGFYSLLAASKVGSNGHVYSFEPQVWNCVALRKSVRINRLTNVYVVEKAVSNNSGSAIFYFVEQGDCEGSLYQSTENRSQSSIVETVALDDFFSQCTKVDIIKMDIEGGELLALQGAKQLILRSENLKLIIEFCPPNLLAAGIKPEELIKTIYSLGFSKIFVISDQLVSIETFNLPLLIDNLKEGHVNLFCEK